MEWCVVMCDVVLCGVEWCVVMCDVVLCEVMCGDV